MGTETLIAGGRGDNWISAVFGSCASKPVRSGGSRWKGGPLLVRRWQWKEALEVFFRQAIERLAPVLDQALGVPDGPPGHGRLHADTPVP